MTDPIDAPDTGAASRKAVLRARFRAYREALPVAEVRARSAAVCARVAALPEMEAARTVHVYWPRVDRGELDTRPLIRTLQAAGRRIVLPVVVPGEGPPRLRHVLFEGEHALRPGPWGLLEPEGPDVAPGDLDAVVVPALGADRRGHRLGHGRGFYDAFLARLTAPTVGVVYHACLVERLPVEPHDVPLSVIATERVTIRPSSAP